MTNFINGIGRAADLIRSSKFGVVLSGAGISTPSGIPDFRSPGNGLWSLFNPMEVASLSAFRYNPEKVFNWLRPLAIKLVNAKPNPAHYAVAHLEQIGKIKTVITQNIDGLHHRAGSQHVLEVHGSLQTMTCISCYLQQESDDYVSPYIDHGEIPRCPECNSILKPDIVLFEEQLPVQTWNQARHATETCDLMLITGSSLEVVPVAGLPMRAVENQAHIIVVNETRTYIDGRADTVLRGDVAEILPQIVAEVTDE
jgi:NAD-dependent deacetylase